MSAEYQGKSNEQIIAEQASSLDAKSSGQTSDSFNPRTTVLSEDSGLNESGVTDGGFPGAQVQVGRGGMTGGGTNPQNIPPEEGGDDRAQRVGETSARFEGEGDLNDKRREALSSNPGGFDAFPRGIDQHPVPEANDRIPVTSGQELQPNQEQTARERIN